MDDYEFDEMAAIMKSQAYTGYTATNTGTTSVGGGGGGFITPHTVYTTNTSGISVGGGWDGDIRVAGIKDIEDRIEKIERHLSILVPNPKKLEKYEALKNVFEQYKVLEAILFEKDDK